MAVLLGLPWLHRNFHTARSAVTNLLVTTETVSKCSANDAKSWSFYLTTVSTSLARLAPSARHQASVETIQGGRSFDDLPNAGYWL